MKIAGRTRFAEGVKAAEGIRTVEGAGFPDGVKAAEKIRTAGGVGFADECDDLEEESLKLVDREQMQEIDRYSIEEIGIPSMVLMERAAGKIVKAIQAHFSECRRILAICGTGNNGGDGICAMRMLGEKGYTGDILLLGNVEKASTDCKSQLQIARACGIAVYTAEDFGDPETALQKYDLFVDAMFGIGLSRAVTGVFADWIEHVNRLHDTGKARILAVDIPSGVNASDGSVSGAAVYADMTVTFGYGKIGLYVYPGRAHAGTVLVEDIGFPRVACDKIPADTFTWQPEEEILPERRADGHKGSFGRVFLIAGGKYMAGACVLAAKAAYRSGAGLVEILTMPENIPVLQNTVPEAVILTESGDVAEHLKKADAVVIGPGMGVNQRTRELLKMTLSYAECPVVIDADGLNVLAEEGCKLLEDTDVSRLVLTPHVLEMARLAAVDKSRIVDALWRSAGEFVREHKVTLVLKSASTIVCSGSRTYINTTGNSGMGTGGSGDTLSGIIGGFLAQGMDVADAAMRGVYFHGKAADWAVAHGNNAYSLMAGDIAEALRHVM